MYLVKVYGYDPEAGSEVLLEEAEFTHGIDAIAYIAGEEGTGRRAELFASPPRPHIITPNGIAELLPAPRIT